MNYTPFIFFSLFYIIIFFNRFYTHKRIVVELQKLNNIATKLIAKKKDVKCNTLTSGRKKVGFSYRNADLYFMNDALIVAGYFNFMKRKVYCSLLIATKELEFYTLNFVNADEVIAPKNINLNSFNNDVFLEFGESSFKSTNVDLRIKNLTVEEKKLINI